MILAFLLAATIATSPINDHGCLPANGKLSLAGKLVRRTFAGPPSYESIKGGDRPETYWLLALDQPVCVHLPADDASGAATARADEVQLMLDPTQYKPDRWLLGRRVVATGVPMGAISGHHMTPFLLKDVALGLTKP